MTYRINMGKRNMGLIFNIQRFSVHDGPGIRDLIFMKGCPLRCVWCSNPESENSYPEIGFNEVRCIGYEECGQCQEVCAAGAITEVEKGKIRIDRKLCTNCGKCAEACPAQALRLWGEYMSIDDVMKVVEEDEAFYVRSGGGITIGGGEPLAQAGFVYELLKECRGRGLWTAIETSGHAPWQDVEKVCQYVDLIFYDIKHMDSDKHKAFTGVGNELILENIKRLFRYFSKTHIIVRTPIVPGYNDSEQNIRATADFLAGTENLRAYELLPYHGFGEPKYRQIGREYSLTGLQPPSQERMAILKRIAQSVSVGKTADSGLVQSCREMK